MPNPVAGTLADAKITASEYLLKAAEVENEARLLDLATLSWRTALSPSGASVGAKIVPDSTWLPTVGAALGTTGQDVSKQVWGTAGPFGAHWRREGDTDTYGADLKIPLGERGLARLFREWQKTTKPGVEISEHGVGMRGEYRLPQDFGKLSGGVGRGWMDLNFPGGEVSVPPRTSADIGWRKELVPGVNFGLSGRYDKREDEKPAWSALFDARMQF